MALFAKVTFIISAMFLVATTASDMLAEVKRYSATARTSHAVGTGIALFMWQLARGRNTLSPRTLQWLDVVGTVCTCWAYAIMGHFTAQPYGSYTGLLAITHVSIARAMVVPSVAQRTLLLGVASYVALIVSRSTMPLPPEVLAVAGTRGRGILEAVLWSTAGVALTTVASTVIYSLQERAREARQLGQYTLEEKIGEGGMGEVYRAHHAMLRRPTAVKLLAGDGSEGQLRRFEKEVQLTARLTHPNTISIFDYGRTPDGVFYYAMELLDGMTLEQLVERHGPQQPARVIHILKQVCGALAEAHRVGLIHRDIKPANIHFCRRGDLPDFVKVLDFGLVREVRNDGSVTQSSVNAVVGTPLYLSPEAIVSPDRLDARSDIYGLGCVAYFLLTGSPPFTGDNVVELCAHHLHTPPPPPSSLVPVPEDLEQVVLSCLAKEREQRPQSARELAQALERCRDGSGWNEADALAWWADPVRSGPFTSVRPPESGEQTRRTICCADLEKRIARSRGA